MERLNLLVKDALASKQKVRRSILEMYYRDNTDLLVEEGDPQWYLEAVDLYSKNTKGSYKHILWTINPRPGVEIDLFQKKIQKMLRKKWIISWMYCIEQRSNVIEDAGKGMHCHVYTEIDKKKNCYQCKREVYNTFKHIVGNKLHVLPKYGHNPENFINYVKGIKKNKTKQDMMNVDCYWREQNGLLDIYSIKEGEEW